MGSPKFQFSSAVKDAKSVDAKAELETVDYVVRQCFSIDQYKDLIPKVDDVIAMIIPSPGQAAARQEFFKKFVGKQIPVNAKLYEDRLNANFHQSNAHRWIDIKIRVHKNSNEIGQNPTRVIKPLYLTGENIIDVDIVFGSFNDMGKYNTAIKALKLKGITDLLSKNGRLIAENVSCRRSVIFKPAASAIARPPSR